MKWSDLQFFQDGSFDLVRRAISRERKSGKVIIPDNYLRAFVMTPHDKVRVVIVGQDPYPHDANGLAFSVDKGVAIPGSLQNIFEELVNDIGCEYPKHGDLLMWAAQGVLLLNTSLTLEQGKSGSHINMWKDLTKQVIESLPNRIWVLWGRHAQSYSNFIPEPRLIISGVHPSPLSAHKGFFGGKYFSTINTFLPDNPIDWSLNV